jgi:hypothetical protein
MGKPNKQYFSRTLGKYVTASSHTTFTLLDRPSNQNSPKVQRRAAQKTRSIPNANKKRGMVRFENEVGKLSLKKMNGGRGVDMAHVSSANELGKLLARNAERYSNAKKLKDKTRVSDAVDTFASGYISSDAEDAPEVKLMVRKAFPPNGGVIDLDALSWLLVRFNRVTRNLFGGDASTNRSIGYRRDIPTLKDGTIPSWLVSRLALLDQLWGGVHNVPPEYLPTYDPTTGDYFSSTLDV